MIARIKPSQLAGSVRAVASKSHVHRLLICAALADKATVIRCAETSQDIEASARCLNALGANIIYRDGEFAVTPIIEAAENAVLDCGESGSTLRFLLPVACALGKPCAFRMSGRLPDRPLSPLWDTLVSHGALLSRSGADTIECGGKLTGGVFDIDGGISSQFISGLLLAGVKLPDNDTVIRLSSEPQSRDYIAMTRQALSEFGVNTNENGFSFTVPSRQAYLSPGVCEAEGDWSNGAFWLCAGAMLGGSVKCDGLRADSAQGDKRILDIIDEILAGGAQIDAGNVPDLVPIMSVLACSVNGKTVIKNASRLRLKESDRLRTTADMINCLGGMARETADGLIITGAERLGGGAVYSANDHRIAMSAAIASVICDGEVTIEGAEAVRKSYPSFWSDFVSLGGKMKMEDTV